MFGHSQLSFEYVEFGRTEDLINISLITKCKLITHCFLGCLYHFKSQVGNRAVFSSVYSLSMVILFENSLEKVARLFLLLIYVRIEGVMSACMQLVYTISRISKTYHVDSLLQHTSKTQLSSHYTIKKYRHLLWHIIT